MSHDHPLDAAKLAHIIQWYFPDDKSLAEDTCDFAAVCRGVIALTQERDTARAEAAVLLNAVTHMVAMFEDSMFAQTNDDGMLWEVGVTDLQLRQDGKFMLSDARKARDGAPQAAALLAELAALRGNQKQPITHPTGSEAFQNGLAKLGCPAPWSLAAPGYDDAEDGVLLDSYDDAIILVDPDGKLKPGENYDLAEWAMIAVNTCAGFKAIRTPGGEAV